MRRWVWTLIAGVVGAVVVVALLGCREEEAPTVDVTNTATPTVPGGHGSGGDPDGTVVPAPTHGPGASAIPDDWLTYVSPTGGFKVSYPKDWFVANETSGGLILQSWDPTNWDKPNFPTDATKLDVIVSSESTIDSRPTSASDLWIGALSGWYAAYEYDPAKSGGLSLVFHAVLVNGNQAVSIAQMFIGAAQDSDQFWHVVSSFQFGSDE